MQKFYSSVRYLHFKYIGNAVQTVLITKDKDPPQKKNPNLLPTKKPKQNKTNFCSIMYICR